MMIVSLWKNLPFTLCSSYSRFCSSSRTKTTSVLITLYSSLILLRSLLLPVIKVLVLIISNYRSQEWRKPIPFQWNLSIKRYQMRRSETCFTKRRCKWVEDNFGHICGISIAYYHLTLFGLFWVLHPCVDVPFHTVIFTLNLSYSLSQRILILSLNFAILTSLPFPCLLKKIKR